jgi:hypothetical protein
VQHWAASFLQALEAAPERPAAEPSTQAAGSRR